MRIQLKTAGILLFTFLLANQSYAEKYALLIGIDNYYRPLNFFIPGCVNDVNSIKEALLFNDFKDENIHLFINEDATKTNISSAFNDLLHKLSDSDIVVIHFSGHGFHKNSDHAKDYFRAKGFKNDSLNSLINEESICLADEALRQSELTQLIAGLSRKASKGGIVVTIDTHFNFDNNFDKTIFNNNVAIISATSPGEVSYADTSNSKGIDMGLLSSVYYESLLNLDDKITYKDFFQLLRSLIEKGTHHAQHIMTYITFDESHLLFNGNYTRRLPHLNVTSVNYKSNIIKISGGKSTGVQEGTQIAITNAFRPKSERNILGTGKVISAEDFSSKVQLDSGLNHGATSEYWAYVTESKYFTSVVHICIDGNESQSFQKEITDALIRDSVVEITDLNDADIIIVKSKEDKLIIKNVADGSILENALDKQELNSYINRFSRYSFTKRLTYYSNRLNVEVRPVFLDSDHNIDSVKLNSRMKNGVLTLYDGDKIYLYMRNKGRSAYVSVVDMELGKVTALLPGGNYYPEDLKIDSGQTKIFIGLPLTISPPFGEEIFKVFVSADLIDMRFLSDNGNVSTRGGNYTSTRGTSSSLNSLFTRGDRQFFSKTLLLEDYTIYNYTFQCKDKAFDKNNYLESYFHQNYSGRGVVIKENKKSMYFYLSSNNGVIVKNGYISDSKHFCLNGVNMSYSKVYFNVISVNDNNQVNVILPNSETSIKNCFIDTNTESQQFKLPAQEFNENIDYYIYCSDKPFDLKASFDKAKDKLDLFADLLVRNKDPETTQDLLTVSYHFARTDSSQQFPSRDSKEPIITFYKPMQTKGSKDGGVIKQSQYITYQEIIGTAISPERAHVKEVRIDDEPIEYDTNGLGFHHMVQLEQGDNNIIVQAISLDGAVTTKVLEIFVPFDSTAKKGPGENYFLGVGINPYNCCGFSPLNNAEKDVKDFASLLHEKYGFKNENIDLCLGDSATRGNIIDKLENLLSKVRSQDKLIIYLSGHGNQGQLIPGKYYFIPFGIVKNNKGEMSVSSLVSDRDITDHFNNYQAKHVILIVDACYSGTLISGNTNSGNSANNNEDSGDNPSKWIITSTLDKQKSYDGELGKNSPFAKALLDILKSPEAISGIGVSKLGVELSEKVVGQKPRGQCTYGQGEFVFKVSNGN